MKVIFVGIHNKPGMEPLDSSTKSGKIIDEIIEKLDLKNTEKVNLFPVNHLPPTQPDRCKWVDEFQVDPQALYVLLGRIVLDNLGDSVENFIAAHHPGWAIRRGDQGVEQYIESMEKAFEIWERKL